ncbi:GAF domain-containing sensor histidine kinase [Virgibacillus sp. DJP39]|uniref:GAF domain-containing sensor histidine kinase n=1 Tax=Virgibacillus sp. DJP39 TaxID=3409790 RepID=UPI003BB7875B
MNRQHLIQSKETNAKIFMALISIVGAGLILFYSLQLHTPKEPLILLLFAVFILICEYYPIPVWKGNTTINFPIIFTLFLISGLAYTLIIYAISVLIVNIISRRPYRIISFNTAQLILSFYISVKLANILEPYIFFNSTFVGEVLEYAVLLIFFHIFNNLMVDIVLALRPQAYPFSAWKQKTLSELSSAAISLVYGFTLFLLSSQNRGQIDFFSFFFFFSPLVGLSLLSAVIFRLRREKSRLKALFSITSELNTMVPTEDWLDSMKSSFHAFVDVDASGLWVKTDEKWIKTYAEGGVKEKFQLQDEEINIIENMKKLTLYENRKTDIGIASACFDVHIKSFVYAPLIIDSEIIGIFIVGRSRTKSFGEDDTSSIATFANQLAIVIKTRSLIKEQEKTIILEERNRIAREIHDGVAQSLAGAIMSLETAERKYRIKPDDTLNLISGSISKLRNSLKEVRESIYALRPYPTERVGLIPAIAKKIDNIMMESKVDVNFEVRGKECSLSSMTEKVLFNVFQESITNSLKHSKTERIDVLISYQTHQILLRIKDYGVGFSLLHEMIKATDNSHFGILNMNEIVEKINGSLQINSNEQDGTELSVYIPKMDIEGGKSLDKDYVS